MPTIAQITDLHITTDKDPKNKVRNTARLRAVLADIEKRSPRPSAIIATGDLVDRGEPEEYRELESIFADVTIPIHLGLGNHDRRAAFRQVFPKTETDSDGFVQYATDIGGILFVMCDTLDEQANGGAFCKKRANWLKRTLKASRRVPTIVALHHPPVASGIQWMDPAPGEEWLTRLAGALEGQRQVQTLICGHLHRTMHAKFAGQAVSVSPATSPQLTLNLAPIDMRVPDGREMVVEEPPGYTLLVFENRALVTHTCVVGEYPRVLSYKVPFEKGFS